MRRGPGVAVVRRLLAIAAVAVLSLTLAAGAQAANPVKTKIELELLLPSAGKVFAVGTLSAADKRCIPGRMVEIYLSGDEGPVYIDTARTADRGGWLGFRKATDLPKQQYTEIRLVALKSTVKVSKNKKITCGGKTRTYPLAG